MYTGEVCHKGNLKIAKELDQTDRRKELDQVKFLCTYLLIWWPIHLLLVRYSAKHQSKINKLIIVLKATSTNK